MYYYEEKGNYSMWTGSFKGIKGYKVWKLSSSKGIAGFPPAARYYENGLFIVVYRRVCEEPDRKTFTAGMRDILGFKGKYITTIDYSAGAATVQLYCLLDRLPDEETMEKMESYLYIGNY